MQKLNIGCGRDHRDGYVNIDISRDVEADEVLDITQPLPYTDDCTDEIICNNVLTQIADGKSFVAVMNELWRILVPEGNLYVRVPLVPDQCAWQDPMDCRRFTTESFTYMESGHRRYEQYGKHYGFKPWYIEILEIGPQMKLKLCPAK